MSITISGCNQVTKKIRKLGELERGKLGDDDKKMMAAMAATEKDDD